MGELFDLVCAQMLRTANAADAASQHGRKYGVGKVVDAANAFDKPAEQRGLFDTMAVDRLGEDAMLSIFGRDK